MDEFSSFSLFFRHDFFDTFFNDNLKGVLVFSSFGCDPLNTSKFF